MRETVVRMAVLGACLSLSAGPAGVPRPRRVSRRSGASSDDTRRLSAAIVLFQRREEELRRVGQLMAQLRGPGLMAVSGEEAWAARLEQRLARARELFPAVGMAADAVAELQQLESLLHGADWEVADRIVPLLEEKLTKQEQVVHGFKEAIDTWKKRLDPVRSAIQRARNAGAPVREEESRFLRLDDLVRQVDRALDDQRYADVGDPLRRLAAEAETPAGLLSAIEHKARRAQRFNRQADVLLLQAPLDDRHVYTVLLRTPSEPGSHGINIQDSSTLVDNDRRYVRAVIDKITGAVDDGLVRRFQARGAPPPSEQSAAAPAASAAAPASDAGGTREWAPAVLTDAAPGAGAHDVEGLIREVGEVMFRLFMPDQMRQYLSLNPCSLTITTNDLELPWELMHDDGWAGGDEDDEDGFLCLRRPVARMPMGRAFPRQPNLITPHPRLRFLLVHADPRGDLPAARAEIDAIRTGLEQRWNRPDATQVEIKVLDGPNASGEGLNQALLSGAYDVIHFAGHAAFDEQDPDLSGLVLDKSEIFFSQKIQRFLEGRPLVFLNACQTGRSANENAAQSVGEYFWKPAEGLASAFLYGGALGCVGSLWPIFDEPAARFATTFYNEVLEGQMIGEAMRQARIALKLEHPESITWASFVLYGDPTFRLVR